MSLSIYVQAIIGLIGFYTPAALAIWLGWKCLRQANRGLQMMRRDWQAS